MAAQGVFRQGADAHPGEEADDAVVLCVQLLAHGGERGAAVDRMQRLVDPLAAPLPVLADHQIGREHVVIARLGRHPTAPLGTVARERLPELGALLLAEVRESASPDSALRHLAEFFSRPGDASAYERALVETPLLARRLVGLFGASPWLLLPVAWAWGFFVIADSAQFSALVTEVAPPHAVGTALALQTSIGFLLTIASIQLVPAIAGEAGWRWAFPVLAVGPALGIAAIARLRVNT